MSILRVVKNSRRQIYQIGVKIGICHDFDKVTEVDNCKCANASSQPDAVFITEIKAKKC